MKNKKSIIMIVILLLLVVVSGTMAWISYQSKKTALVLVLGDDDSFFITIDPYHYKGTLPSSVNYSQLSTYSSVSANNTSLFSQNFNFYYRVNEIDEELLGGSLKFAIRRSTSLNGTYTEVASGTFNSSNTAKDYFVFEDTVPGGTTYYYRGYIYIDGSINNSNLVDKTVNMEFRATFGFTGAQMLINKANDSSITTYTAGNTGEMYTFSQPDTVQLAATTDYRYIGNNPNNYIQFNDEVWRIIGVFDGKIKIIKDAPLTGVMIDKKLNGVGSSDSSGSSYWLDAQLMYALNSQDIAENISLMPGYSYENNLVKDSANKIIYQSGCKPVEVSTTTTSYNCTNFTWKLSNASLNQISEVTYYLGTASSYTDLSASDYYSLERSGYTFPNTRKFNWVGKVGLMYPSDYAYTFAYGVDNSCYNDTYTCDTSTPSSSWLYNSSQHQWTITSRATASMFHVNKTGSMNGSYSVANSFSARPVVYLKSNIKLTGSGTNDENIYKIVDVSKNVPTNGVTRLLSKANDDNITSYTLGNTKEMYMFNLPETEQLEATTDYRFIGANPNNYIQFNNETWRIIGVFDNRIKIIKDTLITNIAFDAKMSGIGSSLDNGSSDWTDSQLMYMLNPNDISKNILLKTGYSFDGTYVRDNNNKIIYKTGCKPFSTDGSSYSCTVSPWSLNSVALNQVDDVTYYLGGIGSTSQQAGNYLNIQNATNYYSFERGSLKYNDSRYLSWNGKVSLMYISDYAYTFAYGVDNICFNSPRECETSNPNSSWLFIPGSYQWSLNYSYVFSVPSTSKFILFINHNGQVYYADASLVRNDAGIRPVVYLKPDTMLIGEGTNDENIYKIVDD